MKNIPFLLKRETKEIFSSVGEEFGYNFAKVDQQNVTRMNYDRNALSPYWHSIRENSSESNQRVDIASRENNYHVQTIRMTRYAIDVLNFFILKPPWNRNNISHVYQFF